jgi:branched-chain amino acid transport system ATP-binding protein
MLRIENLSSGYGPIVALKGVSLHVAPGEIVTLIGANGCGKSTLLNTLSGLIRPMGGRVLLQGRDITPLSAEQLVRRGLALVPEGRQLFAPMSVEENLILGAYTRQGNNAAEEIEEIYALFPILKERRRQPAGTLSGGQQQMLAIGRAMMSRPSILLLDEPSMGLAPKVAREIFRKLRELLSSDFSILLVEQDANLALKSADRGYVLETGQIVIEGECDLLRNIRRATRLPGAGVPGRLGRGSSLPLTLNRSWGQEKNVSPVRPCNRIQKGRRLFPVSIHHPKIETAGRDYLRQIQIERLQATANRAYRHVPYYRDLFDKADSCPKTSRRSRIFPGFL